VPWEYILISTSNNQAYSHGSLVSSPSILWDLPSVTLAYRGYWAWVWLGFHILPWVPSVAGRKR
jgi:hypothetical protein